MRRRKPNYTSSHGNLSWLFYDYTNLSTLMRTYQNLSKPLKNNKFYFCRKTKKSTNKWTY